jgi:hypothetical protein
MRVVVLASTLEWDRMGWYIIIIIVDASDAAFFIIIIVSRETRITYSSSRTNCTFCKNSWEKNRIIFNTFAASYLNTQG